MALKGNKNAVGNKGGARPDETTRIRIFEIKGLTFDYIKKTFAGKDEIFKKQMVLKLIGVIFPREITGEDGAPLIIKIDDTLSKKYAVAPKSKDNSK